MSDLSTVEIYNPGTNTGCLLPQLPEARYQHTQNGELLCGGGWGYLGSEESCDKWRSDSGTWTQSHILRQKRYNHVSWFTDDGVYLIGGQGPLTLTSELVKKDRSVEDGFSLKYVTM